MYDRYKKSIAKPITRPITIFIATILTSTSISTCSDKNTGIISSDVDINIAINVPTVITLPAYKLEAAAEKPHCGKAPKRAPIKGPAFPDSLTIFLVLLLVLCSRNSIARYVRKRNGKSLIPSRIVSNTTSIMINNRPFVISYSPYRKTKAVNQSFSPAFENNNLYDSPSANTFLAFCDFFIISLVIKYPATPYKEPNTRLARTSVG